MSTTTTIESTKLLERIAESAQSLPPPPFGQTGATFIHLMGGIPKIEVFNDLLLAAGATEEVSKSSIAESKGLLVTNDDLQNIFSYVYSALNLPKTIAEAESYLGFKNNDSFFNEEKHKFLAPTMQVEFGKPIREHASLWANLEQSIKNIGNSLNIYAREFISQAGDIVDVLEDLDKYLKVNGFVGPDGKDIVECGSEILVNWKKNTENHSKISKELYVKLVSFHDKLDGEISISVGSRVNKIFEMKLTEEQSDLHTKITTLNKEIEDLQKEYDLNVGLAFTGAIGGIIGWAITGGIFGAKAEAARKKRNQKQGELAPLQQKLDAINRVIGGVNKLESALVGFKAAIDAAVIGLQHVNTVWDSIIQEIDGALDHINKMDDPEYVTRVKSLLSEVKLAKENWRSCGDITKELVTTFDNARTEFNKKPKSQF